MAVGDNQIVFTFTSEGVDTNQITIGVGHDSTPSQTFRYIYVDTIGAARDIEITTSVGMVGAAAAEHFVTSFEANDNANSRFSVVRANNLVYLTFSDPDTDFFFNRKDFDLGDAKYEQVSGGVVIHTEISGQQAETNTTYCYLNEPLRITANETNAAARKIYMDLRILDASNRATEVELISKYGEFDLSASIHSTSIDLMKMARQYHNADTHKLGATQNIVNSWDSIIGNYIYQFEFYSDTSATRQVVSKAIILGGRTYQDFVPLVDTTTVLNEALENNVILSDRWANFPHITVALTDPTANNIAPNLTVTNQTGINTCDAVSDNGGFLIWKSTKGGYMTWGFELKKQNAKMRYMGKLNTDMFNSISTANSGIYKQVNYTSTQVSETLQLKSLSLSTDELQAVYGINFSPAVYYVNSTGRMELMRVTSVSAPLDNLVGGGDFSVSLASIGSIGQQTR